MNIRPLHDRVLVKRLEQQEQVRGGIIIPDTAKEKPQEAEVVAVGPGKLNDEGKRAPMDVKAGDRILIGKYSGSEIKIDEEEYVLKPMNCPGHIAIFNSRRHSYRELPVRLCEERFHFAPKVGFARAGRGQERVTLVRRLLQSLVEDRFGSVQ